MLIIILNRNSTYEYADIANCVFIYKYGVKV